MRVPRLTGPREKRVGHGLAFLLVAVLLLYTAALLPFAIGGVFDDLLDPPANRIYHLLTPEQPAAEHLRLHIEVIDLDEGARTASLRVSGHQVCPAACQQTYQVLLVSSSPDVPDTAEGLPPSAAVRLPDKVKEVTQSITLPVHGLPIRYPFDTYDLGIGVVLQRVLADGTVQSLPREQAADRLFLTFQSQVQRIETSGPEALDPGRISATAGDYPFVVVRQVIFDRPIYLKILTVLLVLLVTAAAAFAVFMRPLSELVTSVGALVLGIWGVRSILVGTNAVPGETAVDLSLSVVTLFLLLAITVRALLFFDQQSGLNLIGRVRSRIDYRPAGDAAVHTNGPAAPPAAPPTESELASRR
jgi:hypothetical protein